MALPPHDTISESTTLRAPIDIAFALSTRIELVKTTLGMNLIPLTPAEQAAGYLNSGHIRAHSRVHWYGWKFGLPTHHHTLITGYTAPHEESPGVQAAWFQDSQARGRFAFFQHDHYFRQTLDPATGEPLTLLSDTVRFALPFGPLGRIAARLLLAPHIRKLVHQRYGILRKLAEGEGWQQWIESEHTPA
jgi:ligand-binding SRPBCC domain-containing protein